MVILWLTSINIDPKCHAFLLYLSFNFPWATCNNFSYYGKIKIHLVVLHLLKHATFIYSKLANFLKNVEIFWQIFLKNFWTNIMTNVLTNFLTNFLMNLFDKFFNRLCWYYCFSTFSVGGLDIILQKSRWLHLIIISWAKFVCKVPVFWEGHKCNISTLLLSICSASQTLGGDFAKFCGPLRINKL